MAKPGAAAKAAMRGARDLSRARMSDQDVVEVQGELEMAQGLRCNGCGRRIGAGFHFTSIAPREQKVMMRMAACSREDCDFGQVCREGATYVEMVEYVWLDGVGLDAAPTKAFVKAMGSRASPESAEPSAAERRAAQ